MQQPRICRIVEYRSRTGTYTVPAIITATMETLNPKGTQLWRETDGEKGVPPLTSRENVHLTVFTPGIPGECDTPLEVPAGTQGLMPNLGGSYQEFDVPLDAPEHDFGHVDGYQHEHKPGTWRWPSRS